MRFYYAESGVNGVMSYNGDGILGTSAYVQYVYYALADTNGGTYLADRGKHPIVFNFH